MLNAPVPEFTVKVEPGWKLALKEPLVTPPERLIVLLRSVVKFKARVAGLVGGDAVGLTNGTTGMLGKLIPVSARLEFQVAV